MSVSAYSSSLTIPTYPGPTTAVKDTRPSNQDAKDGASQPSAAKPVENPVPSTGLLNTVV